MKKFSSGFLYVLLAGAIIFTTGNAQAQTPPARQEPTAQEMSDKEVAQMKTDLSLSTEQVEKVKPISLKYAQKRKEIMDANKGADREAVKTKMQALDKELDAELDDVLTADQLTKWQSIRSKHGVGGPGGNGGGGRPQPSGSGSTK